jgi:LAS superfamily LD-carboxypeptidase LdcB
MTIKYPVKTPVIPTICKQQGCGTITSLKDLRGGHGQMFTRAATDFNRMYAAALDAGFELQVIGDYRTLARMKQLFFDRYQLEPSGRVPKVTRRYQGKTWYLKKGKSPCAAPPEGTPPNQTGGSMHGYGIAVDVNTQAAQLLSWLRRNAPKYNFYWQGQPTLPNGKPNPEWESWHLNWVPPTPTKKKK